MSVPQSKRSTPESDICAYCGRTLKGFQLVSQIPTSFCDQSFILNEILGANGDHLQPTDYVCHEHQYTFSVKYRCKINNTGYSKSFSSHSKVNELLKNTCVKCSSTTSIKYHLVNQMDEPTKNFLVNEVTIGVRKVTRTGTGISETSKLCNRCYQHFRKKKENIAYTPRKPAPPSMQPSSSDVLSRTSQENESGAGSSTQSVADDLSVCLWCGKKSSRTGGKMYKKTAGIKEKINIVTKYPGIVPDTFNENHSVIHRGGREKCYEKLLTVSQNAKEGQSQENLNMHRPSEPVENRVEVPVLIGEAPKSDHISQLVEDMVNDRLAENLPAHLPTIFNMINDEEEVSRYTFDSIIDANIASDPHRKLHQPSKKDGRFIYDDRTDFIARSHELHSQLQEKEENPFAASRTEAPLASEVFHIMKEMRTHVATAGKLCDIYATYPELLYSITLDQLLFTGIQVEVEGTLTEIPPLDPLLFNFFYYITCSDGDAESFEINFSPECNYIYQESYTSESRIKYSRVMTTVFDILHQRNKDNIYPLQILFSDLIANTNPTKLMECFSALRLCASPSKFDDYKMTMAAHVAALKQNGEILGLLADRFLAIHMDNLEQYQKHARNPAEALTSSLVVAVQQPQPSSSAMKLQSDICRIAWDESEEQDARDMDWIDDTEVVERQMDEIPEDESQLEDVVRIVVDRILQKVEENAERKDEDLAEETQKDEDKSEEVDSVEEDAIMQQVQENAERKDEDLAEETQKDEDKSEEVESVEEDTIMQQDQDNAEKKDEEMSEYESDSTAYTETTECTESSTTTLDDYERPLTRSATNTMPTLKRMLKSDLSFEQRHKRLRLNFDVNHQNIPKYSAPAAAQQHSRQSKVEDFVCTSDEKELIRTLNRDILTHALLQLEGQYKDEDNIRQLIPSFKETLAWGEPITEKSNTAYLELIPGPPDNVETILYALSLVKELFVGKLGHKKVVVCGDGKTVNVLYKIKDEYGSEMSWLIVMLGTWHMLKAYMEVFFKKYDTAFCRHLLSKVMTQGNVESILSAKNWAKSHNFLIWIMSAIIRENVLAFKEYHGDGNFDKLESCITQAVDILRSLGDDTIKREDTFNFVVKQNIAQNAFEENSIAYKAFMGIGYSSDDQFALFTNAIEDFIAYMVVYISIRTGNWKLRIAGIKMMAQRFVRSGATLYQWLILRHLADISDSVAYPSDILDRLKAGAWVSALTDSRGATLARDEYHERTASLEIKLRMPKQLTKKNMQVLTQYVTYSAATRNNLLAEIFRTNDRSQFEISKGCRRTWVDEQEKTIDLFSSMLQNERIFAMENRELKQPFTERLAKQSTKKDFLGRDVFGGIRQDYGKEILLSYVLPRFCSTKHAVSSEKMPMRKRGIALFPKDKPKKVSRAKAAEKEKEDMIGVLAAGIIQLSSNPDSGKKSSLAGCQISDTPGLVAENQYQPNRKKDKTGIRKIFQKRYENAFIHPIISPENTAAVIRDGMQDLFLAPLKHHLKFIDYYNLFVEVKVKPSFAVSTTVCIDFDTQAREALVPKDNLRLVRDSVPATVSDEVDIDDNAVIPPKTSWISFLSNRRNKLKLVQYLCSKMIDDRTILRENEKLIVSFEGKVYLTTSESCQEMEDLKNNHLECDTRAFFLLSQMQDAKPNWVIKSTDTDFMFTALLNYTEICDEKKMVYIHYNTSGQGSMYCNVNTLVDQIAEDPQFCILKTRSLPTPKLLGMLHFLTGCDDLSFLRGFTKNFCFKVFEKYSEKISPEKAVDVEKILAGDESTTLSLMIRFLAFLYGHKFSSAFERGEISSLVTDTDNKSCLDVIRKKTWHRTISANNTLPSLPAIQFHSKRFSYVLNSFGNASKAFLTDMSPDDYGWKVETINGESQIVPRWDSDASIEEINMIRKSFLLMCGCKTGCQSARYCKCFKNDRFCSNLCGCIGCLNKSGESVTEQTDTENLSPIDDDEDESGDEDENHEEENEEEEDTGSLNDEKEDEDLIA